MFGKIVINKKPEDDKLPDLFGDPVPPKIVKETYKINAKTLNRQEKDELKRKLTEFKPEYREIKK